MIFSKEEIPFEEEPACMVKLTAMGITVVITTGTVEFKAFTSDQMKYVQSVVNDLKQPKYIKLCCENISDMRWNVFSQKRSKELSEFRSKDGCTIEFKAEKVSIVANPAHKVTAAKLLEFLEELKKMEGEHSFDSTATDDETLKRWCLELEKACKNVCYAVVKHDQESKTVIVLCLVYDDVLIVKHRSKILRGTIIITEAKRKAEGADGTASHKSVFAAEQKRDMSWKNSASLLKTFSTLEGIDVYVYKADICRISVDCIVNAANEDLNHGGGVALAIARRAGKVLIEEGDRYIKDNGKIGVGKVCITPAGNLPFKCVIHAVGPRWSDYNQTTDVSSCANDLKSAVKNSFLEAGKLQLLSIGLPAISSGKNMPYI